MIAAFLLPSLAHAQVSIQIEEIGLQDFYTTNLPTPVRIHISAPAKSEAVLVELTIRAGGNYRRATSLRTDRLRQHVQLIAGHPLDLDLPVMISGVEQRELAVTAVAADGREIGRVDRDLKSLKLVNQQDFLVALYCKDEPSCEQANSQIVFAGDNEAAPKQSRTVNVVILRDLPREWWYYSAVSILVLAGPISSLTKDQLTAAELFARSGGTLVLLENEIGDTHFLAPYRRGASRSAPLRIGHGRLLRVPDLKTHELSKAYEGEVFRDQPARIVWPIAASAADSLLSRVGVSFAFPKLRWLLVSLAAYILIVGLVNFTLLRRFRRLEWGWMSVTAIASLFAIGTYAVSLNHRPKNFTLDDVVVYRMDDRSPIAVQDRALRISSPVRHPVAVSLMDPDVPTETRYFRAADSPDVQIGSDITERPRVEAGWDIDLGPPPVFQFLMLQWSFRDLPLEGFHVFPGTVHWTSNMHLKNDTGESFQEAIYLDFNANQQRIIPAMRPGDDVDLTSLPTKAIWNNEIGNVDFKLRRIPLDKDEKPDRPFSIAELPYIGFDRGLTTAKPNRFFGGLCAQPRTGANLDVPGTKYSAWSLVWVSLDEP